MIFAKKNLAATKPLLVALTAIVSTSAALACDSEADYIGSICVVSNGYCPKGYTEAKGQTLSINGNAALFAVIGNRYGGDGKVNFMLPNLQSRTPVGVNYSGNIPDGRTTLPLAQYRGAATTTLTSANLAAHTHAASYNPAPVANSLTINIPVSANNAGTTATPSATKNRLSVSPGGNVGDQANIWGSTSTGTNTIAGTTINAPSSAATVTVGTSGSGQPVNNLPPESGMRFCVATTGYYPPRP
jgi:microcystin-dependent protein